MDNNIKSIKRIISNTARPIPNRYQINKFLSPPYSGMVREVWDFVEKSSSIYLGFGGCGDALLTLASAYKDNDAKVVFFANPTSSPLILQFYELFNTKILILPNIMGQPLANAIYDLLKSQPGFRQSAHLADNLDYGDWKNWQKYLPRMVTKTDWKDRFGISTIRKQPWITIAPTGSYRDWNRKRFLTREEFFSFVYKYSKTHSVYATGSLSDYEFYGLPNIENVFWMTSDYLTDGNYYHEKIDLIEMIRIINGSESVFSTDTYLKTYSCLTELPTFVFKTKFGQKKYKEYGTDATDFIFLNKEIWKTLNFIQIEDF